MELWQGEKNKWEKINIRKVVIGRTRDVGFAT